MFKDDVYFTASPDCMLMPDNSGLPTSPATVLSGYWAYTAKGCLGMTGNVYVLTLADGRHVKLSVLNFYYPDVQTLCDTDMPLPMDKGSGNIGLRWAFLP
jgi:hypothetical protein